MTKFPTSTIVFILLLLTTITNVTTGFTTTTTTTTTTTRTKTIDGIDSRQRLTLVRLNSHRHHCETFSPSLLQTRSHTYEILQQQQQQQQRNQHLMKFGRSNVKLHVAAAQQPSSSISESEPVPLSLASTTSTTTTTTITVPFWKVLWQFTRPHTLIGSAMAVPALALLATPNPTFVTTILSPVWVSAVLYATIPALLMNLYITGLNQITDIDIDKINKPYLPLAAGTLSIKNAKIIVLLSLFISLWIGSGFIGLGTSTSSILGTADIKLYATTGLNIALWGSGILGTLYSLNPFRFKRYPIMAAFCIVAVRGMIINASFYTHMKAVLTAVTAASSVSSSAITSAASASVASTGIMSGFYTVLTILWNDTLCWYSSSFFALFGLVIALMKDVPDVIGDKLANIRTFPVRIGQTKIFHFMSLLLTSLFSYVSIRFIILAYNAAFVPAVLVPAAVAVPAVVQVVSSSTTINIGLVISRIITSLAASTAAMSVRKEAKLINPTDSQQVYTYYMHLWKLFYLSYLILPFAR